MSEDPRHPWGSGATRYRWTPAVENIVQSIHRRFPHVTVNTYVCHPWCGWADVSLDVWGAGGRGDPIPQKTGLAVRRYLMNLAYGPKIRHTIFNHAIWTSWGGYSYWSRDDHTGTLRHLHVTYWPD